jgi:hypothetical protein
VGRRREYEINNDVKDNEPVAIAHTVETDVVEYANAKPIE